MSHSTRGESVASPVASVVDGAEMLMMEGAAPSSHAAPSAAAMLNDDEGIVPSFAVSAVIECLGWPGGAGALIVNHIWLEHGRRVFALEINEQQSVRDPAMTYYKLPQNTKSTISIAFSPDLKTFASTHGDHTVKIVDFETGEVKHELSGHPRTPWTVKFHPTNPHIVASGCLGFEVRVWDISGAQGVCCKNAQFDRAIISLSFHPSGELLAVAAGTAVYLWAWRDSDPRCKPAPLPSPARPSPPLAPSCIPS